MKAQPSPKKKNKQRSNSARAQTSYFPVLHKGSLRVRLAIAHSAASRAQLRDAHLKHVVRSTSLTAQQRGTIVISLAFVSDAAMRRLNREFAGNDYVTDVLSFAAREVTRQIQHQSSNATFLGDIAICLPQAMRQARAARHSLAREVDWLLTHGILHLLGYDHATERENQQMRALEQQILNS